MGNCKTKSSTELSSVSARATAESPMQLDRESCAYSGGAIYEGVKGRCFHHFARGCGLDRGFEGAL